MSADCYAESIRCLLASEGGYVNHPSDPGGPTNFGITLADYRRYMEPDATAADVRSMKIEEAKAIYREKYWRAMRCDDLPAGVRLLRIRLCGEFRYGPRAQGAAARARSRRHRTHG